jgi:hypothetical protein
MIHLAIRLSSGPLLGGTARISNKGGSRRTWRISKIVGIFSILTAQRNVDKS